LASIPSVVMVHDPRPHPGLMGKIVRHFEDPSLLRAARCMLFSHSLIADLYARGVQAGRISVAPLGLMDYTEGQVLPAPRPQTILFFGRITPYKGIEILLPAFEQVQRQFPQARLILAGSGSLLPYLVALHRLTGVEVINRWIDESEIHALFARAGVVALPYTSAAQSRVLTIAASFALPVVTTRTGGLSEQLEDGKTGWLVPPGDVNALAAALQRLLAEPALAEQMGITLREDYLSARSWERAADTVLHTCQAAVGQPSDL
jgi:glycosyltransferase involved in cell wall biosynthesis